MEQDSNERLRESKFLIRRSKKKYDVQEQFRKYPRNHMVKVKRLEGKQMTLDGRKLKYVEA